MGFFQEHIFSYFTATNKKDDPNKDINDKGTLERYNEVIGNDIDSNIMPLIDNLLANIYVANTCYDRYVPYLESTLGYDQKNSTLYFAPDIATRRKLLKYYTKWCDIRGTARCYELLFKMLGITMVLTEDFGGQSFDGPQLLDNPNTPFDSHCPSCSDYSLTLTGLVLMTPQLAAAITSIIMFNNPINAVLSSVTYNGVPVAIPTGDFNGNYNQDFMLNIVWGHDYNIDYNIDFYN